ncbi:hypothetical protein SZ54_4606 [Rhizobium sp. UR51a]|nr:hypothetical protein SZ54_4606 [Rhizobium sp. UR51a]
MTSKDEHPIRSATTGCAKASHGWNEFLRPSPGAPMDEDRNHAH